MAGVTKRWVNERARDEGWPKRLATGRGGQRLEYDLSKLPADILCKIRPFTTGHSNVDEAFSLSYEQRLVFEAPLHNRRKWEKYKLFFI